MTSNYESDRDCPPNVQGTINILRQLEGVNIRAALCELIDNSIDAGAKRVLVDWSKDGTMVIQDDGAGCADLPRMMTLGEHTGQRTTALGRWGVGLKSSAIWLADEVSIESVAGGSYRKMSVVWPLMHRWSFSQTKPQRPNRHLSEGTRITLRAMVKRNRPDRLKLLSELGYHFAPAITSGVQLLVKWPKSQSLVEPWAMPPCVDERTESFWVDGLPVEVRIGRLAVGAADRSGLHVTYGHRTICRFDFRADVADQMLCGVINLGAGWVLSSHKGHVTNEEQFDRIEAEILGRFGDLIKAAGEDSQTLALRDSESVIEQMLSPLCAPKRREQRGKGESKGTAEPKETGRKRRKAAKSTEGPGSVVDRVGATPLRVKWEVNSEGHVGRYNSRGNVLYLNVNHPFVEPMANKPAGRDALATAAHVLAYGILNNRETGIFAFARDYTDINAIYAEILRRLVAPSSK